MVQSPLLPGSMYSLTARQGWALPSNASTAIHPCSLHCAHYTVNLVVQLRQSLVSLHDIRAPTAGVVTGATATAGNPLEGVIATTAASETQGLVEKLKQEEAALQQRLLEIEAQQQYEQVSTA